MKNTVQQGDCLQLMKAIPDGSIDCIICDLPYQTTACKWDVLIPFEPLWAQYKRIIKPNGAIVLTASQPFMSALVMSNPDMFRYEWIWKKSQGSNFATVKYMPMKEHESVLVFSLKTSEYHPQMIERSESGKNRKKYPHFSTSSNGVIGAMKGVEIHTDKNMRCPSSVIPFNNQRGLHPTQKPVALFEYLIRTYTNEGDLVMDNCAGSGTTAIACINTGRDYILMDRSRSILK